MTSSAWRRPGQRRDQYRLSLSIMERKGAVPRKAAQVRSCSAESTPEFRNQWSVWSSGLELSSANGHFFSASQISEKGLWASLGDLTHIQLHQKLSPVRTHLQEKGIYWGMTPWELVHSDGKLIRRHLGGAELGLLLIKRKCKSAAAPLTKSRLSALCCVRIWLGGVRICLHYDLPLLCV